MAELHWMRMRSAEECLAKANAMKILGTITACNNARGKYNTLAEAWLLLANIAAWQDEPMNHISICG